MRRLETGVCLMALAFAAAAGEPAFRFRAPIQITQPAAFVQLKLSPGDYAKSMQDGLSDLRIVDADGARVPFAVLAPRAHETQTTEQLRAATLYPLPKRPPPGSTWPSPLELSVQGDLITVKRASGMPDAAGASAGWLVDLGEKKAGEPAPRAIRLQWSGPAEFSTGYELESSDDLRRWRRAAGGHLMALASARGPLTQPLVPLPPDSGRFVRLAWTDPPGAPVLTGAHAVATRRNDRPVDPPFLLELAAATDPGTPRALHVDLGARLPISELDLRLPPGTRVAPVRVQARASADAPWDDIGSAVFYRIEREGTTSHSPALPVQVRARYLRVLPDERAAALDAAQTRFALTLPLASVVFASQGKPPFSLLAGSPDARSGALPASTLVPALEDERARFGQGTLGPWSEAADVARQLRSRERVAAMRPYVLWSVLLLGVAALGWMVWRLSRGAGTDRPV